MIKLKRLRHLIGQFGHMTDFASCKQPESIVRHMGQGTVGAHTVKGVRYSTHGEGVRVQKVTFLPSWQPLCQLPNE